MSAASDGERLPHSVGGLIDFALAAYAARGRLYLLLALAAFAVQAGIEYATPAPKLGTPQGDVKLLVLDYAAVFLDAFIIAAVAVGTGSRVTRADASNGRILGAAVQRWLPVAVISVLVVGVQQFTLPLSALGSLPDPAWAALLTAPLTWLLWGMLSLAAPIAALSGKRSGLAVIDGLWQAVTLSLHPRNGLRLCAVAFASIVPSLLQSLASDAMMQRHVPRPIFWSNVPIDALTVGLLAALQTAFAVDFARRAGRLEEPPRSDL